MAFQNRITGAFGAGPLEIERTKLPGHVDVVVVPSPDDPYTWVAVIITHTVDTRSICVLTRWWWAGS